MATTVGQGGKEITNERTLTCPHCNEPINVFIKTEIVEVVRVIERRGEEDGQLGLTPEKQAILDTAKAVGLLAAFEAVVIQTKHTNMPKSIERFFLTFLGTAVPVKVPGFVLQKAIAEFPKTRIEFRAANGVAVLLTDGVIRSFVSQSLLMGTTISGSKLRTSVRVEDVDEWIRTRFGFVAGKGLLFAELQKKSYGSFVA